MHMQVPIFARALDTRHAAELKAAGADSTIIANVEAGANLAASILSHLGSAPPPQARARPQACASSLAGKQARTGVCFGHGEASCRWYGRPCCMI